MRGILGTALVLALAGTAAACEDVQQETMNGEEAREETPAPTMEGDEPMRGATAALMVSSDPELGEYVTDGAGMALYVLEEDPEGESICYDECAEEWPPFLAAQGAPDAGAGAVREDLIGTVERRDGSTQVTYAGQPLYYYHDDEARGDVHGHHVTDEWGEWYLIRPDGEHVEGGEHEDHEASGT